MYGLKNPAHEQKETVFGRSLFFENLINQSKGTVFTIRDNREG